MKIKFLTFLMIFLILINTTYVYGWNLNLQEGLWDYAFHDHWKIRPFSQWDSAKLNFTQTVNNFTYWYFELDYYINGYGYWILDQDIESKNIFKLEDSAKTHEIIIQFWIRDSNLWGWHTTDFSFVLLVDGEELAFMDKGDRFKVWIVRTNDNKILIQMRSFLDGSIAQGWDETIDFGVTWFDSVILTQINEVWGCGEFECYKSEIILSNELGEGTNLPIPSTSQTFITVLIDYIKDVWKSLGDILPQPIRDFMNMIGGIFEPIYNLSMFIFNLVIKFIPFIGAFYMIYIITVVIRCFNDLSIEPLFNHVLKLINLFASIGNFMVSIVKTIWGFIKFW